MNPIFRNFLTTLRRFRMATLLNVLGLSAAFAAFMLILVQLRYERGFDRCYPDTERIYRIEGWDVDGLEAAMSLPMAEVYFQGSPEVEIGALDFPYAQSAGEENYFTLGERESEIEFKEFMSPCYPEMGKLFGYKMVEGRFEDIEQPGKVVIPRSLARKYFPDTTATGHILRESNNKWEIVGVYEDFPQNSFQRNDIRYRIHKQGSANNWDSWNYYAYVRLRPGGDPEVAARQMMDAMDAHPRRENVSDSTYLIRLNPITEVYYDAAISNDMSPKGSRAVSRVLMLLAISVIVIAGINFVNFSTAMAPMRIKGLNTRLVFGSSLQALRRTLLLEGVCISFVSFLLSLVWIAAFLNSDLGLNLIGNGAYWWQQTGILGAGATVALVLGLLASLYPAWYSTRFDPALVLKGNFGLSLRGRRLRTSLVGLQYIISTALIIATLFLQLQNRHLRKSNIGFDWERLAVLNLSHATARQHTEAIRERLTAYPAIKGVAFSQMAVGCVDQFMTWGRSAGPDNQYVQVDMLPVTPDFTQVMGLHITEGRDFLPADNRPGREEGYMIMNECAARQYGFRVGDKFPGDGFHSHYEIVGMVEDFHFRSLRFPVTPLMLAVDGDSYSKSVAFIRIEGDPEAAVAHIRQTLEQIAGYPFVISFFDTVFDTLYHRERQTTKLITLFSLLAILISLAGVFGLVVFETQYRTKEIGLRKINGATVGDVLWMFNLTFVKTTLVCFLLAMPLARWGVGRWLESFSVRTPMHWWVFALSLLIVLGITLLTVTFQSWRAATVNPVRTLRTN